MLNEMIRMSKAQNRPHFVLFYPIHTNERNEFSCCPGIINIQEAFNCEALKFLIRGAKNWDDLMQKRGIETNSYKVKNLDKR